MKKKAPIVSTLDEVGILIKVQRLWILISNSFSYLFKGKIIY